jgi:hypothetical protein
MILLSSLMLLVAGVTVVACVTDVCLHPDCDRHSCCCWRPLSFWWFHVPGVTSGVVGISAVPFEHAVAGGLAVTGFPAVETVLAVVCVPADLL